MTLDIWSVIAGVITAVISAATVFYVKDVLEKKAQFRKLKAKLDRIAGMQASVMYDDERLKIVSIDEEGIVLESKARRVFLPIMKVLQQELVLPTDDYERIQEEKEREKFEKTKQQTFELTDELIDRMFPKLFSKMRDEFIEELLEEQTEFSAVVGVKFTRLLKQEGYELRQIEAPSRREE